MMPRASCSKSGRRHAPIIVAWPTVMQRNPIMHISRRFAGLALLGLLLPGASRAEAGEFATKDEAVALVKQAIARTAEIGMDKAKIEFMDHGGKFVDRDLYLIVIDRQGIRVVHGQNPKLVGKTYFDAIDVDGVEYGKVVQQIATGPGTGWFKFAFKDPITGKVLPKENYVETAGDYTFIAGAYQR
jgi:signal transduction histidine kinase